MKISRWIHLLVLSVVWCCRAQAVGVPHFNVDKAANAADLIVLADVKQVQYLGSGQPIQFRNQLLQADTFSADLSIRRTLKGTSPSEITVIYSLPKTFVGYNGIKTGTRMVFLRRDEGQYRLADPYYSNFPGTLEASDEYPQSENPPELVLSNMLAVLASTTASDSDKYEILRVDYALPSNEKTIAAVRKALDASTDRELNEKLQGELIYFGDLSHLPEAASLLSENQATQNGRAWLLYVIGNRVRDLRAVQAIAPLLNSPDNSVREAAVEALWHIGAPAAVPTLVQKLDDPDEKVRFYAVRGLSDIENQYGWGGPSESEFHGNAQKYLNHWQEWSKNRPD
ncbi:MAG: HEAT repeat domain-containing protein [Terracidiphilus sp.]